MASSADSSPPSASRTLEELARSAIDVVKKARRHRKGLEGDNFYANKLATLQGRRHERLQISFFGKTAGDSSAIAELIESVFSPSTERWQRTKAYQELCYSLRTTWHSSSAPREDDGLFPLSVLAQASRGYLVTIGRQMNGCFASGWHDAAAVMMRRLIEISIVEAFEGRGIASKLKDASGNYLQLSDLVAKALAETTWTLSRNTKKALPSLRDVGHMSAHGRYFCARQEDIEALKPGCRIVVEEFLRHAGLL
jgi:hypothetical protein